MNHPKITVVTVCYNAERDIEKTIQSVINQTYDNIEYIIVDGASKDGTMQVVEKYKDKIAKIVSEPDKGIYDAMNKALKLATGDFLIFMGSDDVFYTKNVVENVVSSIKDKNSVYYGQVELKGLGTIHWGRFNKLKWAVTNVSHQAVFYPRCVYSHSSYDVTYKLYADYVYNLNLIRDNTRFIYTKEVVTLYNMTGASASNKDLKFEKDEFLLKHNTLGLIPTIIGLLWKKLYQLKECIKR